MRDIKELFDAVEGIESGYEAVLIAGLEPDVINEYFSRSCRALIDITPEQDDALVKHGQLWCGIGVLIGRQLVLDRVAQIQTETEQPMIRFKQLITAEYNRRGGKNGSGYTLFALGEDGLVYKSIPQRDQLQHEGWLQINDEVLGEDFQDRNRYERTVRRLEDLAGRNMAEAIRLDTARLVRAPFTRDQVEALNRYQTSGGLAGVGRPFVCENREETRHPRSESILRATPEGLVCDYCNFTQKWAHEFMINPAAQTRTNQLNQGPEQRTQDQRSQDQRSQDQRSQDQRSQAAGTGSNR